MRPYEPLIDAKGGLFGVGKGAVLASNGSR